MTPRLTMSGIAKSYGPTAALRGVDLELQVGEVYALVGENGAGKSTLMKVLSGAEQPDAGTMTLDGAAYNPAGPQAARKRGVAMIYQELAVCPDLSVAANVLLGLESSAFGFLKQSADRERVRAALAELGHPEIDLDAPVSTLTPAAREVVEIARALLTDVKLLVLDEPTSALTQEDAKRLFDLVRRLKSRGVTVVYISHFLEEIEAIADRFTVLRDGQAVGGGTVGEVRRERIIEMMVGRSVDEQYPRIPHDIGELVLCATMLVGEELLPYGAAFALRRGEILGIAGIVGSGRTEMLRAIYGLDEVRAGGVEIGTVLSFHTTPAERIAQGVGLLSEDRKEEGLSLEQSIADNVTLSRLDTVSHRGFLSPQLGDAVASALAPLQVKFRDIAQPVGELSGGNQQKIALARLLHQKADILLLDEPTKGVDVGSKAEIYRLIGQLAASGKAILMVSSYLPELLGVCDTLAVMCRGQLTPIRPVSEWTPEQIIAAATGA